MGWKVKTRGEYPDNWKEIATQIKEAVGWCCIRCKHPHDIPSHHVLTVHHLDGQKNNCAWWNLLPLCQKCHLSIQGRVNPDQPYFLEHSAWFQIYVAGFYAHKYLDQQLTREQAMAKRDELLALERLA